MGELFTLFEKEFNDLIVGTFHLILAEEMRFVKTMTSYDVSAREIHLIENIGKMIDRATISDMADSLQITLASITVMANKLEGQGYVLKRKDETDARSVRLSLTQKGVEIDNMHTQFHMNMIKKIAGDLTDFEKDILTGAVKKLRDFFQNDLAEIK